LASIPGTLQRISAGRPFEAAEADRRQARIIMGYIRALLLEVRMLAEMVRKESAEKIELDNGITIEVATCSFRTIRGRTIVAALADEIAFWVQEGAVNPDVEVLAAIRPALAQEAVEYEAVLVTALMSDRLPEQGEDNRGYKARLITLAVIDLADDVQGKLLARHGQRFGIINTSTAARLDHVV
jgi:hypothetical protein